MALLTVSGMGMTQKESVAEAMNKSLDQVRVIATQFEMRTLQTAVLNEYIADNIHEVSEDFPTFVRRIAHSDNKDVAADHWGSLYEIEETEGGYLIVSTGPDKESGTDDDIVALVKTL
jgi:hypothetical protein